MGIEPTQPAWKAGVLPLNYTRLPTSCRNLRNKLSNIYPLDLYARTHGGGGGRIRTYVGVSQQIYSLPSLAA